MTIYHTFLNDSIGEGSQTIQGIQNDGSEFGVGISPDISARTINSTDLSVVNTISGSVSGTSGGLSGTPSIVVNGINATSLSVSNTISGSVSGTSGGLSGTPSITVNDINATSLSVSGTKNFDIPHPTKEGYRLKYACLEGPTADVYIRGKLENSNVIELPDYWCELIDQETLNVSLTSFCVYQELYVEKIEYGRRIIVKNNLSGPINCNYVVYAERKDVDKNIAEYQPS